MIYVYIYTTMDYQCGGERISKRGYFIGVLIVVVIVLAILISALV